MTNRRIAKAYSTAKMERAERPFIGANTHERRNYSRVDRHETRTHLRTYALAAHTIEED